MTEELVGMCPFCGFPVYVDVTDDEGNYPKEQGYELDPYSGLCYVLVHTFAEPESEELCPIARNKGESLGVIYDSKESAIAAWNRRAEPIGNSDELPEWVKEAIQTKINDMTRAFSNSNGCIKLAVEYELAAYDWVLSLRKPEE